MMISHHNGWDEYRDDNPRSVFSSMDKKMFWRKEALSLIIGQCVISPPRNASYSPRYDYKFALSYRHLHNPNLKMKCLDLLKDQSIKLPTQNIHLPSHHLKKHSNKRSGFLPGTGG